MKINWVRLRKRIPHLVRFKTAQYRIVWCKELKDGDHGETTFDNKQITLSEAYGDKETVHTYIHELLHAVSEEYDVGLTEKQVRKLEKAVYWFLKEGNIFEK